MIKRLKSNFIAGLRLAFLRDTPCEAFAPSWHSVIFIFLLTAAVSVGIDIRGVTPPFIFDLEGIEEHLINFSLLLLGAYTASLLFAKTSRTLLLVTILYNALFFPWLVFTGLHALQTDFLMKENIIRDLNILHWLWAFLIIFRAVVLLFEPYPLRQMLASLVVLGGLFYFPNHYFYYSGFWYHDYSSDEPSPIRAVTHEELFQRQNALLQQGLAALKPSRAGHRDVYGVVFGSYGYQDVFMREVGFVAETLSALDNMDGRILRMINNKATLADMPLAIETNLRSALKHLGGVMQKQDVLLLYLTSHGAKDGTLSVNLGGGYRFNQITAEMLADILKDSGIKNRIVFVSACYSGTMIDALKDDNTLIMTSAAADRTSYGCSDESKLTYFAKAYFAEAFPVEKDWVKAFAAAKTNLEQRENAEGLSQHSNPQIFIGKNIAAVLPSTLPQHWPEKLAEIPE